MQRSRDVKQLRNPKREPIVQAYENVCVEKCILIPCKFLMHALPVTLHFLYFISRVDFIYPKCISDNCSYPIYPAYR